MDFILSGDFLIVSDSISLFFLPHPDKKIIRKINNNIDLMTMDDFFNGVVLHIQYSSISFCIIIGFII